LFSKQIELKITNQIVEYMKKAVLAIIALCLLVANPMFSQGKKAKANFAVSNYNFGKIKEDAGPVGYNFEFTNSGSEPLIITNVTASCGCTTPTWTKTPIAPGGKGFVRAEYDPMNRPGIFNKSISVFSNGEEAKIDLIIQGDVTPRQRTVEDNYRYAMGDMRLITNHVAFAKLGNTEIKTETVEVINTGQTPLKLGAAKVPAHLKVTFEPTTIPPGKTGKIIVVFDAKVRNDWDFVMDRFFVTINGTEDLNNRMNVSASIMEDFSKLTEAQKANAPLIEFNSKSFEFGTIKAGEKVNYVFKITNKGKSDLKLRKVNASCGCTLVKPDTDTVKPGQSTEVKVEFNSVGISGVQNKTITVITNDPNNSKVVLWVKGTVNQ